MKAYQIARVHMMLMVLGAAMLLTSSVRAQQEMDPSRSDGKAVTAQNAAASKNAEEQPVALESNEATEEDVAPAGFAIEDGLLLLILFVGTGSIFVYAKLATRRELRPQAALRESRYGRISGVATR